MQTIPGPLLYPALKLQAQVPDHITLAEADRYHLYQTLVGDATDGYPGCPGVGEVAANKVLDERLMFTPASSRDHPP